MNINLDSVFSLLMNPALHEFQARALQNPDESLSKMLLPTIALIEGLIPNEPTYLHTKRRAFGANFCCAGQIAIGDFATLETALTSPQARDWRLGTAVLDANHSPNQDVRGRNVSCSLCPIELLVVMAIGPPLFKICYPRLTMIV